MGKRRRRAGTLAVVLESLVGRHVSVELKGGDVVSGVLEGADEAMGVHLRDASREAPPGQTVGDGDDVKGRNEGDAVVRGSQVRFVHIPKHVDVARAIGQMRKRRALARRKYK